MDPTQVPPPIQMVQLLSGFQISQALYVAAKLGVADELVDGPKSAEQLAVTVDANPASLRRLLRTLASLGVFTEQEADCFALTPLGTTLVSDTPGSMRDLALMWMETHYGPFGELLHTVRTGEPAATYHYGQPFFGWLAQHPEQVARFSAAMANLTDGVKIGAVSCCDLQGSHTLVDVGGADGRIVALLLDRHPDLRGVVFDLPHVVLAAEKLLEEKGLTERTHVVGGDFFDSVPAGDAYICSFILHDWSDDEAGRILTNIRRAAEPGARLELLEFVVPPGDTPHMSKMIDLTMLGMLSGHERTATEFELLLSASGFRLERILPTPTPISLVEAVAV